MSITWTWAYSSFSPLQVLKNPPFSLARNILNGDKSYSTSRMHKGSVPNSKK